MIIDKELLDKVTGLAKSCERLRMNHNFHESWDSKAQVMLNALEPGTFIPIGRHRNTNETLVVLRGAVKVVYFDDEKRVTMECVLDPSLGSYGVSIPKGQWHQVQALQPDTVIFETREGPYSPLSEEDTLK